MMKIRFLNVLFLSSLFACAQGANFTLKTDVHDTYLNWTFGGNYENGTAPSGSDDTVIIPANVTAKVVAGDNASFNLINSIKRITPQSGAKLLVDVQGESETNSLSCIVSSHVSGYTRPGGTLEKTGPGTLILGNGENDGRISNDTYCYDYMVDMVVTQGMLILPHRQKGNRLVIGAVDIAESASLKLPSPASFQVHSYGLSGAGTMFYPDREMTADGKKVQYVLFHVYAAEGIEKNIFSGEISGYIQLQVRDPAVVHLTGTDSSFSGSPVVQGRLGVESFGDTDKDPSSIGTGNVNFSGTGGFVEYLGREPETTHKPFWWTGYGTIDAGAFGGVTFCGKFSNTSGGQYVLHLTGSNTTECVLANPFISTNSEEDGSLLGTPCLKKSGSGTWRMANNSSRNMHGVIAVEDGTLKFNSIAERGVMCSVGYSDALRECANGAFDTLADVDYAFLLGGNSTTGTLEYSGTVAAGNATRPVAVKSKGRFVSDSAAFFLEDVYALGSGVKTLVLAGNSQHGNCAMDLSDGNESDSKLAVDKEGAGTWTIMRNTSFTGPLISHGGVLRVDNRSKFNWYRICFTENAYGSERYDTTYSTGKNNDGSPKAQADGEKAMIQLLETALYDADGNNLLSGFQTGEPGSENILQYEFDGNYTLQEPGTVVIGSTGYKLNFNQTNGFLSNLFDNASSKMSGRSTESSTGITTGNPSSWMVLVARLPENALEAARIDFMSSVTTNGPYNGRALTAFRLDGSVDGLNWEEGIAEETLVAPGESGKWYSDPEGTKKVTYGKRPGMGFEIKKTKPASAHSFTSVGAANGGIVDIIGDPYVVSGLVVDASASAGIISNVVFAAEGRIDVVNVGSLDFDSLELPGDYSHLQGHNNLSSWEVRINDENYNRIIVTSVGGKIVLKKQGLKVFIR